MTWTKFDAIGIVSLFLVKLALFNAVDLFLEGRIFNWQALTEVTQSLDTREHGLDHR